MARPSPAPPVAADPARIDERRATQLRIVIADNHPLILAGIKALVQTRPAMDVVGATTDWQEAMALIENGAPDVVAIEVPMPGLTIAGLARYMVERRPAVKFLVLVGQEDSAFLLEVLRSGAHGALLKRSAPGEIEHAINTLMAGGHYIDTAIAIELLVGADGGAINSTNALSERELMVLKLLARGFGNKEVAAKLNLSIKTIQTYKTRGTRKLGLRTRSEIVRHGAAHGWLDER